MTIPRTLRFRKLDTGEYEVTKPGRAFPIGWVRPVGHLRSMYGWTAIDTNGQPIPDRHNTRASAGESLRSTP